MTLPSRERGCQVLRGVASFNVSQRSGSSIDRLQSGSGESQLLEHRCRPCSSVFLAACALLKVASCQPALARKRAANQLTRGCGADEVRQFGRAWLGQKHATCDHVMLRCVVIHVLNYYLLSLCHLEPRVPAKLPATDTAAVATSQVGAQGVMYLSRQVTNLGDYSRYLGFCIGWLFFNEDLSLHICADPTRLAVTDEASTATPFISAERFVGGTLYENPGISYWQSVADSASGQKGPGSDIMKHSLADTGGCLVTRGFST